SLAAAKDCGSGDASVRALLRTLEPGVFSGGRDPGRHRRYSSEGPSRRRLMTISLPARAVRFHDLNRRGRLLLPNAWDAASARIFEEAGFSAIGTTSAGIAYSEGYQDAERIGRDAMVRAVAKIVNAVSVPVSADIEAGYGPGAAAVAQTVDAVLEVGAAGVNL